jgi:hypothetical protein
MDRRQRRCLGLNERLAEEERQPRSQQHQADADRDIVHPRETADRPVQQPQREAGQPRYEHTQPGAAGKVRNTVTAHRAHDQDAFQAEVDATALLGETLAEAHEQERRADADSTAQHRDRHTPPA